MRSRDPGDGKSSGVNFSDNTSPIGVLSEARLCYGPAAHESRRVATSNTFNHLTSSSEDIQTLRLIICVFALCFSALVAAQENAATGIILRVYNTSDVPRRDLDVARDVLADIFLSAAEIEMTWQECGTASASAPQCGQVLAPHELVIRIVHSPMGAPGPSDVFGYSHVDTTTRSGTLATVLEDRVEEAARRTHTAAGPLLGRVIAHEVGHLLLGSVDHSDEGIMRTRWSDAAVRRHRAGGTEWSFSRGEGIGLREGLLARTAESTEYGLAQSH
jgi:hypothetical protein